MASEEKMLELLRRAHTVIGEGLIENALDESAEALHNEIAEVLGIPVTKRDTVRCEARWFVAGGRVERQCRENAEFVCAECGSARCGEHDDLGFDEHEGRVLCEECLPDGKRREVLMAKETGRRAKTNQGGDIRNEWDPLTTTTLGDVVWLRYGDGLIVIARRNEHPDDALARHIEREKREQGNDA